MASLAGQTVEFETHPPPHRDVGHVPAIVKSDAGALYEGSLQPAAGPRTAIPRRWGSGGGHCALSERAAEPEDRRPQHLSSHSEQRGGHGLWRVQLAGNEERGPLSPRHVHFLETLTALSVAQRVRRAHR